MMMPEGPCQQCYLPTRRITTTTVTTTTTTSGKIHPPISKQEDPTTWSPQCFNVEVKAEAEAVAVVPEPAGASSMLKQHKLPEPALPNPTRSTETCLAWHILIRQLASPRTPTDTASGSMISSRIQKLDTSAPGNHGRAERVAKAKRNQKPRRQHGRG